MITGFLFWNKLLASQGQPDWVKLYISRIFRLVPLYWLAVTAVCILVILLGGTTLRVSLPSLLKSILMWLSFQGAPNINAFKKTSIILASVTWTLKYEWMFYISLPLLGMVLRIARKTKMALWMLGIGVATISVMGITIPFIGIKTRYFVYFLVGAIAASIRDIYLLRKLAQSKIGSCVSMACMLLLFMMFGKGYGKWQTFVMAVFFCCVALGNSLFGMLKLRALVVLGEISYSVYILHGLLLYICFSLLFPDFMNAATSLFQVSLGMSVVGSLLVLLSWISFCAIERPFMRFGKSIGGYVSRDTEVRSKGV
jgi:peptidoglycan/LPS O-acetylase OafA/YrhL